MEQGPKIEIIHFFSGDHAQASAIFARKTWIIEKNRDSIDPSTLQEIISEQKSYVVGSIFTSVSFLEAYINELYCEAERGGEWAWEMLNHDKKLINLMETLWKHKIPRTAHYSILEKYGLTLDLAGKPPLLKGDSPYQDVESLIKLRNSLIHYEPEPVLHGDSPLIEDKEKHKFEKQLRGRFEPNPLVDSKNPFYPDRCLSHGCAEWGLHSSLKFVEKFMTNMGLKSAYKITDHKYRTREEN